MLTALWLPFAFKLLDRYSWDLLGTVVSLVTLTADHAEGWHVAINRTMSIYLAVTALWNLILRPRFASLPAADYIDDLFNFSKICKSFLTWSEVEQVGHLLVASLTHLDSRYVCR